MSNCRKKMEVKDNFRDMEYSDMDNFDPNNYIILVNAISINTDVRGLQRMITKENRTEQVEEINLVYNPERIADKLISSCSLLVKTDEYDNQHTWSRVGLIIKAPYQNILRSSPKDLGADFVNPSQEIEKYTGGNKGNPKELAESDCMNEVVVQGTTKHGKIEIIGVFINEHDDETKPEEERFAKRLSRKLNLPLKRIEREKHKIEDKPIEVKKIDGKLYRIEFSKNNKRYFCELNSSICKWGIYATGDYGSPFVKDKEEAQMFFDELNKLPEEDKVKYKDIIEAIPSQYELWAKYLDKHTKESEKEIIEKEIAKKNYLIDGHNEECEKYKTKLNTNEVKKTTVNVRKGKISGIRENWKKFLEKAGDLKEISK